jgi:hypothetical protein
LEGAAVRAVWAGSGSFAALRMTAKTNNSSGKNRSNSNGKNKQQRQEQTQIPFGDDNQ